MERAFTTCELCPVCDNIGDYCCRYVLCKGQGSSVGEKCGITIRVPFPLLAGFLLGLASLSLQITGVRLPRYKYWRFQPVDKGQDHSMGVEDPPFPS